MYMLGANDHVIDNHILLLAVFTVDIQSVPQGHHLKAISLILPLRNCYTHSSQTTIIWVESVNSVKASRHLRASYNLNHGCKNV